jgi:hypothetical protein
MPMCTEKHAITYLHKQPPVAVAYHCVCEIKIITRRLPSTVYHGIHVAPGVLRGLSFTIPYLQLRITALMVLFSDSKGP